MVDMDDARLALEKIIGFPPSPQQWDAITAPLEPAMIIAGAGTGKTTVMAARVLWLVMTGQVEPDRILGLTFTSKATTELQQRVRSNLSKALEYLHGPSNYEDFGEPVISTYNAFGSRLLKEHALRLGLEPDARVVVDALKYQLAFRTVSNTQIDLGGVGYSPMKAVQDLVKFDESMANYFVEPQNVINGEAELLERYDVAVSHGEDHDTLVDTMRKRHALAQLLIEYRANKIASDVIDYSDQIRLAATAAQNSPAMCAMLKDQFHVVLLDEYQDTSVAQKILLQELFGDGHPVMAVGDPCQAIYRWRGAEISNMSSFVADFKTLRNGSLENSRIYNLTFNRRSGQQILDTANALSEGLRNIHPEIQPLEAGNPDMPRGDVHVALVKTSQDEVNWIGQQIADALKTTKPEDIAILLREKSQVESFVIELERRNIPVQVADAGALLNLPEVRDVVSYLQVIADPTNNPALVRILMSPRWQIGARDLALLGKRATKGNDPRADKSHLSIDEQLEDEIASVDRAERVSLIDELEVVADSPADYSPEAAQRMAMLATELRELRSHAGDNALDLIGRVIRTTGIGVESLSRRTTAGTTRFDRLAMLMDLAGSFRNLDGDSSLHSFVAYISDSDRYGQSVEAELPTLHDAVTIMTIHKSKGLEFPVVAIPGLIKGKFPSTQAEDYWNSKPFVVPHRYRLVDQDPDVTAYPAELENLDSDYKAHKSHLQGVNRIDEDRLVYVAVTRAEKLVIASSHWWGPTQVKPRHPSEFLEMLKKFATRDVIWELEPEKGAKNPQIANRVEPLWPARLSDDVISDLQNQAAFVAMNETADAALSTAEQEIVASWDADIDALLKQVAVTQTNERIVRLPKTLSASQVMQLQHDEQAFLRTLVRPMPRQPSAAADRGTTFHAWVENYYGQRGLFDIDSLSGSSDTEIYSDDDLGKLKSAFTSGMFASRTPHDLETPFALVVAGRTWRGRIDAVFAGSLSDPADTTRWTVIDWKTGAPGSANPLQLHIYRNAWAQIMGVDVANVDAAFYFVSEGVVEELTDLLDIDGLSNLI